MYLERRQTGAGPRFSLRHDFRPKGRHLRIELGAYPVITPAVVEQITAEYPHLAVDWEGLLQEAKRIVLTHWPGQADWLLQRMAQVPGQADGR